MSLIKFRIIAVDQIAHENKLQLWRRMHEWFTVFHEQPKLDTPVRRIMRVAITYIDP